MTIQQTMQMLKAGEIPERYLRNIGTIGVNGQILLLNAKVAVVGAGGLGGSIIELLARMGVGYLRVIDGDTFVAHNLNRQLLATEKNLGKNKTSAATERIADVNSDVYVEAVPQMLDETNAESLLQGTDVIVDALDNIPSRLLLSRVAKKLKIPLVHGAIAGFTGQVFTQLPGDCVLEKIYGQASCLQSGIEAKLGNPAPTPALAAALEAQEVLKILTGYGELNRNRILYFDILNNVFELMDI